MTWRGIAGLERRLARMSPSQGAAFWIVREDSRSLLPAEMALLEAWLSRPGHRQAHDEMRSLYDQLEVIARTGAHRVHFKNDPVLMSTFNPGDPS